MYDPAMARNIPNILQNQYVRDYKYKILDNTIRTFRLLGAQGHHIATGRKLKKRGLWPYAALKTRYLALFLVYYTKALVNLKYYKYKIYLLTFRTFWH